MMRLFGRLYSRRLARLAFPDKLGARGSAAASSDEVGLDTNYPFF